MTTRSFGRRRRAAAAAALVSAALVLTGCSGGAGGSSTPSSGTTLTMWARASLEGQAKAFVAKYNSSHRDQVRLTIVPNDDYQTKVGAAAGSKSLPDLFSSDVVYLPNYTSQGLLTDVTDRIKQLPFASDLAPSHIKAGTWEGKEYAVPFVMDLSVLFYNKDIYKKAGLDPEKPPTSLTEFASQAETISKAKIDKVSGTYFGGNCGGCLAFTWWPSIWAAGGEVLNADGSRSELASADAQAVYSTYRKLYQDGAVAPGAKDETGATWVALFPKGQVGVQAMPSSLLGEQPDSTGVAPIPGVNGGGSTFVGGDSIGIAATSTKQDAAWRFISWTLSEKAQLEVVAKANGVVVRSDLANNEYAAKDPRLVTINQIASKGKTPLSLQAGAAFNDPNGPWLKLVRDQVFGDVKSLQQDNAAIDAVLGG